MKEKLVGYFKAGFPGLAIQTSEEARVISDIVEAAKAVGRAVATWSATEGLRKILPTSTEADRKTLDLQTALANTQDENTTYIFRDTQNYPLDKNPNLNRQLRDALAVAPSKGSTIVFVGYKFLSHPSYEKFVTVLDYSLPSKESLGKIAAAIAKSAGKEVQADDSVLRALSGLSTTEAENTLALSFVEKGGFDSAVIYREKIQAVKKSGMLEIIDPDPRGLDAIGGLENLKEWVLKRRRAYTPEAEKFGLPAPRGILLCGVPGTGKSLSAKAVGTALGIPTLKFDISRAFGSLVGQSEQNIREMLDLAGAISPCVLWLDELDKSLAGSSGSGSNDSGVTRRVFGSIIQWMQEHKKPVFLFATANQVENLPPELLRKGRFDEIFAVDLPTDSEREQIFRIQLAKKNRDAKNFNLDKVVTATKGFTGSEIEEVVTSALYDAFELEREVNAQDLVNAANNTVPLSKTASEQIESIRNWAKTRARPAGKQDDEVKGSTRKIKA